MDYLEALAYINDKNKFGSRLGLDSIGKLMELLGNPQDKLNIIHLAGTNGKGSTSSYLASCIREAGYDVGLFTSPYLERFNERIRFNNEEIADEDLGRITSQVRLAADRMLEEGWEHPTTFEIVTAIAFLYYREREPQYVVLEVGLGGSYDSTNVIKSSLASVITTIDIDHVNELGDSLDKIAYQKAGIIKEDGLVISYPQKIEAKRVVEEVARDRNAELYTSPDVVVKEEGRTGSSFDYDFRGEKFPDIRIGMIGHYQIYNAALALTSLLVLREKGRINIENQDIYRGLLKARWPGRLEVLRENPTLLIDGAHNLQGIRHLARAIKLFGYNKLILGIGILADKDVDHMVEELAGMADEIVVTEVNMPRKIKAEDLAQKISKYNNNIYIEKEIKKALAKTLDLADKEDLIVFAGSLYLIGDVRSMEKLL